MAKISVLILTDDKRYCTKLNDFFMQFYEGEFTFTIADSPQRADELLASRKKSVILVGEEFADSVKLPEGVTAAYLTPVSDGARINGINSVCKYRKGSDIRKAILNLYAEIDKSEHSFEKAGGAILFTSANGGAGATSCAAAFAKRRAKEGQKVLFLSFDYFGDPGKIFGETNDGLSDFVYALAAGQNLLIKADTLIHKESETGLMYVGAVTESPHLKEFSEEFAKKTVESFTSASRADIVVIDVPYLNGVFWKVSAAIADTIIVVAEGNVNALAKLERFAETIGIDDLTDKTANTKKLRVLHNKEDGSSSYGTAGLTAAGHISKVESRDYIQVINALAGYDLWKNF